MHPKITPLYGIDPCERFDLEKADIILTNLAKKNRSPPPCSGKNLILEIYRGKLFSRGVYNQAVMFIGHKSIWFSHFFFKPGVDKKSAYCIFLSIFDPTKLTRKFATEAGESIGHSGQIFRQKIYYHYFLQRMLFSCGAFETEKK